MTMMLLSLFYLHSLMIMHRDLNPENILIDELQSGLFMLKVSNFGISKLFEDINLRRDVTTAFKTTPAYASAEAIRGESETQKVDLWALGIIVYQLITGGKHPFIYKNGGHLMQSVMKDGP